MLTALLSRADVSRHLQALHLLQDLRAAFTAHRALPDAPPLRVAAPASGGTTLVRHATLPGIPAWAVTVRTEGPPPHQRPRALLQLHDAASGQLLAVMEAGHLATLRASLVGALAADVLARPDAKHVAVLGAGPAASSALKALRLVRSIERVRLYEPSAADNFELAFRLQTTLSMAVQAADSAAEAVAGADLVLLTGQVPLPVDALQPGTHVTVLAAETFAEPPLPFAALSRTSRFCDAREPALAWGVPFAVELGQVLAGEAPGRASPDDVTVFASVGPAWLDLLGAWHVYEGARHDEALTRLDLES